MAAGLKLKEVSIIFVERREGTSKMSGGIFPRSILRRTGTSVSFDQEHEKPVTAIRQEYGRQPPGRLAFMHTYFTAESEHPGNQNVKK